MPKVAQSKPAESVRTNSAISGKVGGRSRVCRVFGNRESDLGLQLPAEQGIGAKFIDGKCGSSGGGGGCFR